MIIFIVASRFTTSKYNFKQTLESLSKHFRDKIEAVIGDGIWDKKNEGNIGQRQSVPANGGGGAFTPRFLFPIVSGVFKIHPSLSKIDPCLWSLKQKNDPCLWTFNNFRTYAYGVWL